MVKRPTYAEQLKRHRQMELQRREPHGLFANDEALAGGALVAAALAFLMLLAGVGFLLWLLFGCGQAEAALHLWNGPLQ